MRTSALFAVVAAVAVVLSTIPPTSFWVYHFASNLWPPTRAMKVVGYANGALESAIVASGLKLDVFQTLHSTGPITYTQLAKKLDINERGCKLLLNALVSLDLLIYSSSGATYALTSAAEVHLLKASPDYLGALFLLFGNLNKGRLDKMAEYVRHGGTLEDDHAETPEHEMWHYFAQVTSAGFGTAAQNMASLLAEWAKDKTQFKALDIAAGSGTYGLTLAATYPQARVVLQDWATVLEHTRKNLPLYPTVKDSQVTFLPGNFFEIDLQGPYDVIYASQFYHHFNASQNLELTKKVFAALKPGGRFIINDFIAPEEPRLFDFAHLFSMLMLSWTASGEAYTESDYHSFLTQAGFIDLSRVSNAPQPNAYYLGTKP